MAKKRPNGDKSSKDSQCRKIGRGLAPAPEPR